MENIDNNIKSDLTFNEDWAEKQHTIKNDNSDTIMVLGVVGFFIPLCSIIGLCISHQDCSGKSVCWVSLGLYIFVAIIYLFIVVAAIDQSNGSNSY